MKQVLVISVLLCMFFLPFAQGPIGFAYDAAGNRIKREIVMSKSTEADDDFKEETFYDTVDAKTVLITHKSAGIIGVSVPSFVEGDNGSIEVYSLGGILVFSQPISGSETMVDLSCQSNGIYILTVIVNGERSTWKITKQ